MKLPKIETFYKINKEDNQNKLLNDKNSNMINQDNLNNNIINSSNKIFFNIYHSTKYTPRIFSSLKFSKNFLDEEIFCNNFEIKKDEKKSLNRISSYKDIKISEKFNGINNISSEIKKEINKDKKIKLIKNPNNLPINNNFNTINNSKGIKILVEDKSINTIELYENHNKSLNIEKDEDKTILPNSSKILNHKKLNALNFRKIKYSDILNYRYEINKDSIKKMDSKGDNKKFHEYYLLFNNNFYIKNNSWKNNILKNILPKNIQYILKGEELKKISKINAQISQEKEKNDKKNKKINIFRNINRINHSNSFFNSDINNFYKNYKNNINNKIAISSKKENSNQNKIIFTKIQKNIISDCYTPNIKNHQNSSSGLIKSKSNDLMVNVNCLYNIKKYN